LVILRSDAGADGAPAPREVPYDQLVFALGSISNYLGMTNIQKFAFNFKSLLDAIRIRITSSKCSNAPTLCPIRSSVFASYLCRCRRWFCGGGACRPLNDFAHGILADYPRIHPRELNIVLVHSRDRVLPELSESLARYAQEKMQLRGYAFA